MSTPPVPLLSTKLDLMTDHGFALRSSRQPHYAFDWHQHDCAMLLWPRIGSLRSAWRLGDGAGASSRLARGAALLLPASTPHRTAGSAPRQHHGELYLSSELLRHGSDGGPLRLDGAALAMLDALLAPALSVAGTAHLVDAIVAQLRSARPLLASAASAPVSLARRMLDLLTAALELDDALPSIDTVAATLGVSTRHLQRACRHEFGASPVALRRRLLARHAQALLASGRSLADVSRQLGFVTSGHLTRLLGCLSP